jgi:pimeloyl-ACP methyl ester carboxylesterase
MERTDAPGPLRRRGPRPLLLHLTLAMLRSNASLAGSRNWSSAWPSWNADALAALLAGAPGAADGSAADGSAAGPGEAGPGAAGPGEAGPADGFAAIIARDRALIAGIAAYRRHPWKRDLPDPPALWHEGGSRLLDYGAGGAGRPVLFVPSLVNRAHVLDLAPGHSMLRWLAGRGMRPLLLDWGWPGETERRFTLTDYVAGRLERGLAAAARAAGGPVALVGYCMGGTLAVAAAQRRPDLVRALALLAAPWDFHADAPDRARQAVRAARALEPGMGFAGALSIDAIQTLFAMLDPAGIADKYRAFARLAPEGERARLFVALEDWLNDGVPLAAPVARECLGGWYGANTPARREWRIAGLPVEPGSLAMPALVVAPGRDRIVPPASARALAAAIPGATLHEPPAGHIGMTAGHGAERTLWQPLRAWLEENAAAG